jgi:hypothetical protein
MAVISVPSSAVAPGAADVPGDGGSSGVTYTKAGAGVQGRVARGADAFATTETGRGILVRVASGAKNAAPFLRIKWIGDQYDSAAIVTAHHLTAIVTAHHTGAIVTTRQLRAVITTHRLRGEDL